MNATIKKQHFDGFVKLEAWHVEGQSFDTLVLRASDSVAGILVDRVNRRVLLVNQQRVPMIREDNPRGEITELPAGRFDVDLSPKALLVKEAREEAGVTITEDEVELLNGGAPMALSAGILTEQAYLAIAVIHPDRVEDGDDGYGVAAEGEKITRVWMPLEQFVDPSTQHQCLRVWAAAQYLGRLMAEEEL